MPRAAVGAASDAASRAFLKNMKWIGESRANGAAVAMHDLDCGGRRFPFHDHAMRYKYLSTAFVALTVSSAVPCLAQMPATPVLQNAWANSGITVAGDYGNAKDATAVAGALAWSPVQSRFQLSAGAGIVRSDSGGSRAGYGARLAIPVRSFASGSIGAAIFGGVGVTSRLIHQASATQRVTLSSFPIGVAFGFRHSLGSTRGVSVYVSPFYLISRQTGDSLAQPTSGSIRASLGVDATIAPQIGLTLGYEAGATAADRHPGPIGGIFGVGISYALHRQ